MWLMGTNSSKRIEEMQRQNMDKLNSEISKYFTMKRSREKMREKLNQLEAEIRSEVSVDVEDVAIGKPIRTIRDLINNKIFKLEELLKRKTLKGYDKRIRALIEVLCCVPKKEYSILKEMFQDGKVFILIPDKELAGSVSRIKEHVECALYLSPALELNTYTFEYVKKICAHEISHVLNHSDFSIQKKESVAEAEANLQAAMWGF